MGNNQPIATSKDTLPVIRERIITIVERLLQDHWGDDDFEEGVQGNLRLIADIGLTSVDFVTLFVAIEEEWGQKIGFHDLIMVAGKYVDDLSIDEIAAYVEKKHADIPDADGDLSPPGNDCVPEKATIDHKTIARFRQIIPEPLPRTGSAIRNKRVIFLLSAPRTGSTLLQAILAGHPRLFAPPELHLLLYATLDERRDVLSVDNRTHFLNGTIRALMELDGMTAEQAARLMATWEDKGIRVDEFYGMLQQRLGEDRCLVDKTPVYGYSPDVLRRAESDFIEPFFIHLVRHPCGMALSFADAKLDRFAPFMRRHEGEFSRWQFAELAWLVCNQNIVDFLQDVPGHRWFRVKYEDVITDPVATVHDLCRSLGVDFVPNMLNAYDDKTKRMTDGLGTVSRMSGDLKFHLHTHIDPDVAFRWKRFVSEDMPSDVTWALAELLGYRKGG
ncbi:MAG: sulfotransferase [Gammaproteobacteria bacterium]|nr:sulfotransferase [Gammaproteobacteria bacterium]